MTTTPNSIVTPQTPKSKQANTAAAQTTFPPTTSPSNTVKIATAGASGARLTRLTATPQTTITAAHIQLFRSPDGGTTKYFVMGKLMAAATVDTTHQADATDFGFSDDNPMILGANEELYMACSLATSVNYSAEWADF